MKGHEVYGYEVTSCCSFKQEVVDFNYRKDLAQM